MGLFGRKAETAKDPVCGMDVDPKRSAGTATHAGKPYFFCSRGCLAKFTAEPERYSVP